MAYISAKVLNRESLDGVDAQGRVGLDDSKSAGDCTPG